MSAGSDASIAQLVATECAAAAEMPDPLLYAGLRLIQQSATAAGTSADPTLLLSQAAAATAIGGADDVQLEKALDELESLRRELQRVEAEEARHAAKVITLVNERDPNSPKKRAESATAIQAGFHGFKARSYVESMRDAQAIEDNAAVIIQASYHGQYARAITRERRKLAREAQDVEQQQQRQPPPRAAAAAGGGHQHRLRNSSYVRGANDPYGLKPERFGLKR